MISSASGQISTWLCVVTATRSHVEICLEADEIIPLRRLIWRLQQPYTVTFPAVLQFGRQGLTAVVGGVTFSAGSLPSASMFLANIVAAVSAKTTSSSCRSVI